MTFPACTGEWSTSAGRKSRGRQVDALRSKVGPHIGELGAQVLLDAADRRSRDRGRRITVRTGDLLVCRTGEVLVDDGLLHLPENGNDSLVLIAGDHARTWSHPVTQTPAQLSSVDRYRGLAVRKVDQTTPRGCRGPAHQAHRLAPAPQILLSDVLGDVFGIHITAPHQGTVPKGDAAGAVQDLDRAGIQLPLPGSGHVIDGAVLHGSHPRTSHQDRLGQPSDQGR
jgi:hypothetical protein